MQPEESLACPVCGGELQPHIICPFCGTDITLKSLEGLEPTYKCPVCGKDANTKFICNECGSEFKYDLITEKMGAVESAKKKEGKPVSKKSTPKAENLVELKGGLTNGISATKKRGKGLTNGIAAEKKGAGLTNGLKGGMVNGTGVTNGTKPAKKPMPRKKRSKMPAAVAVVLVLMLIFGAFYIFMLPQKAGMRVDGDFSDWNAVSMKNEFKSAVNPLDMVRYSSKISDGELFLYLEGREGVHLFDSSGSRIYAFVDSDNNAATGYRINGIGADYLCKVYGEGGKISARSAYRYSADADGFTWDWTGALPLSAAYNVNRLEMGFFPDRINDDYRVAFYTSDSLGNYEVSSVNIGKAGSVYFEARPWSQAQDVYTESNSIHMMDIGIFATGAPATIQSLRLTVSHLTDVALRDSSGNTVATMENGMITLNRELKDGERANYELWGTVSPGANGTLISLDITQVVVSPASAILKTNIEPFKAYFGEPSSIFIDGAFGDWRNLNTDELDSSLPAHIDIKEYSSADDSSNLYFYLGVQGKMMAGVLVPEKYAEGVPAQPPVTPVTKTETGEDVLRVYINSDYKIEVLGREGKILSENLYRKQGNSWQVVPSSGLLAEKDLTRIEGGVPLNMIGNPSNISLRFEMSDWEGNIDSTNSMFPVDQSASSTRYGGSDTIPVPEFSDILIPVLFTIGAVFFISRKKRD